MAILSFCLGAASVVAAAYAHKYYENGKAKKRERLRNALAAVSEGRDVADAGALEELYRRGWVADAPDGKTVTAAGKAFLEQGGNTQPS